LGAVGLDRFALFVAEWTPEDVRRTVVQTDNEFLLAVIYTNARPEPARFDLSVELAAANPGADRPRRSTTSCRRFGP
jgi:hypothetical protein